MNSVNLIKRLYGSFGIVLALLVLWEVFASWNYRRLEEANQLNIHTYKVLLETEQMMTSIATMTGSARGFLSSGDEFFNQQYRDGQRDFINHFNRLHQLTRIAEIRERQLPQLQRVATQWQNIIEALIAQRRRVGSNEALSIANARVRERLRLTREMIRLIGAIETTETTLLAQRTHQHAQLQHWMRLAVGIGGFFSVLICAVLVAVVAANNKQLATANAQLDALNRHFAAEVAERRQAEENLRHAVQELERSNADLEQFAYVASHDLQEPLRAVGGCVQVLQRRYAGQLDARADEFIRHAVEGAERMQTLIHNLLAFSRIGTHGKPFESVDTQAVLQSTLVDLRLLVDENEAQITSDELPVVTGDNGQLQQVFQNLISNAIKFRGTDAPHIHIGCRRENRDTERLAHEPADARPDDLTTEDDKFEKRDFSWIFRVRDNGIGIEDPYFERIFVMFQRLHTRDRYPGTGIGLALCKKIIERHGGRIWVESQFGHGSTFFFSLPPEFTAHSDAPREHSI